MSTGTDRAFWPYLRALVSLMPRKAGLALGVMVCLSLTEGIGLLMLVPLLQLVGLDVQRGSLGRLAELVAHVFATLGLRPTLAAVLAAYVLIVSAQGLLSRWQTTLNLGLLHDFVASLRHRLYTAVTHASWLFFARSRSSDFTHVLTSEVDRVGAATYHLLQLAATALVALVYLGLAFRLSPALTAVVLACGGILMVALRGHTGVARAAGGELSDAIQALYAAVTEHLGGMKTAKSYGAEDRHGRLFARLTDGVRRLHTGAIRNQAEAKYWFDVGTVLLLSLILYASVELLAVSTAELLLLLFLFARMLPRLGALQQAYHDLVHTLPAFAHVMETEARCAAAAEPRAERREPVTLHHAIRLDRVRFAYEQAPVARDLDLTIRAGETTALVGPSGSGKTTVADLVLGLLRPDAGRVLVDGVPLGSERVQAWREQIGYVAQETFLFHDTIRANLLWAAPGATGREIEQALRLAAAEEFVTRLPEGLGTIVGDRGVRLSGGERQRLALARALLRKPALLILDEATSNLDSENEQRIQRAIDRLHGSMTILVISHRLSTVRAADIIHVLEDGRIVESGTWETLAAREDGRFRALCRAQGVEIEEPLGESAR